MPGPSAPRIAIDSPLQAPHSIQSSVDIAPSRAPVGRDRRLPDRPAPPIPSSYRKVRVDLPTAAVGPERGEILRAHRHWLADEGFAASTAVVWLGRFVSGAVDPRAASDPSTVVTPCRDEDLWSDPGFRCRLRARLRNRNRFAV